MSESQRGKYTTVRISLEPAHDAAVRAYCDQNHMTYALFLRTALNHMMRTTPKSKRKEIPSRRDVYGRLGKTNISVRLTCEEIQEVVRFARSLNFKEKSSFVRLGRYAIITYLASSSSGDSHPEQSPEPACEDNPPP